MSNAEEMIRYTRAELQEAMDGRWPERGVRCDRCKTLVPQFAELLDADRARIVRLILEGRPVLAQAELEACTGAPPRFAKIWVLHSGTTESALSRAAVSPLWEGSRVFASQAVPSLPRRLALTLPNKLLKQTAARRRHLLRPSCRPW
jgi:hypothetical protein